MLKPTFAAFFVCCLVTGCGEDASTSDGGDAGTEPNDSTLPSPDDPAAATTAGTPQAGDGMAQDGEPPSDDPQEPEPSADDDPDDDSPDDPDDTPLGGALDGGALDGGAGVDGGDASDGTVTADDASDGTVTADDASDGTVTADDASDGTVTEGGSPGDAGVQTRDAGTDRPHETKTDGGSETPDAGGDGGTTVDVEDGGGGNAESIPVAGNACPTGVVFGDPLQDAGTPELIQNGVGFLEGPVWFESDPVTSPGAGVLYYTNFSGSGDDGRIRSYDPDTEELDVLIDQIGVNGLAVNELGSITGASHELQGLVLIDPVTLGENLIAGSDSYMGEPFNSVNDLVVRADGHVYFTDPTYQQGNRPGQNVRGYYHFAPGAGSTRIGTQNQPNGIALSPDGAWLYVAGTGNATPLVKHAVAIDGSVDPDGETIGDERSDGMAIDCAGNLYLTTGGGSGGQITVLDSDGELIGTITGFSGGTTNAAFGGPEHRTLFVTTSNALWSVELSIPGLPN